MFIGSVTLDSMRMEMIEEQIFLCFHRVDSRSQVTGSNIPTLFTQQVSPALFSDFSVHLV